MNLEKAIEFYRSNAIKHGNAIMHGDGRACNKSYDEPMNKIKYGDLFEVNTQRGLVYLQYTHKHTLPPKYGTLVRVISGTFDRRPKDFSPIVIMPTLFQIFIPLQASLNAGLVELVGHEEIPMDDREFSVFRHGVNNPITKKVDNWWFWDGQKEWLVGSITKEQKAMPILECITVPLLIELLDSKWTPETDPYT